MDNTEMERLLGGYATNTLTEEERLALFNAALEDQELFNALQDEEALRDLLSDPESRREVERALRQPDPVAAKPGWFRRPWIWGLAGSFAAACATLLVMLSWHPDTPKPQPALVAVKTVVAPSPVASPPPARPERESSKPAPKRKEPREAAGRVSGELAKETETQQGPVLAPVAPPLPATATRNQAESAPQQQDVAAVSADKAVLGYRSAAPAGAMASLVRSKKAAPVDVVLIRDGVRLAPGDLINKGDVIQLAVRCNTPAKFTLLQDGSVLVQTVPVELGQEVVVPPKGIPITAPTRITLTSPPASVVLVLSPGKPAQFR